MPWNVHVGWLMANPKVIQKTFSFHEIKQLAVRLLATGQQAKISNKVDIFSPVVINILYDYQ